MIVIGSNTSDNGQLHFTEDVSHFMKLQQNGQLTLLKRSAKNKSRKIAKKTFVLLCSEAIQYFINIFPHLCCRNKIIYSKNIQMNRYKRQAIQC